MGTERRWEGIGIAVSFIAPFPLAGIPLDSLPAHWTIRQKGKWGDGYQPSPPQKQKTQPVHELNFEIEIAKICSGPSTALGRKPPPPRGRLGRKQLPTMATLKKIIKNNKQYK